MLSIGHRGAAGHEPENTLRSVARAMHLGVDWIEVDVQVVDGELIVFHDDTLERTTNGSGVVAETSFSVLRELDAGCGEKIPTLSEVLDLVDARVGLNIELKGPDCVDKVTTTVSDYLELRPAWRDKILLSSFDETQTAELADRERNYKLGILFEQDGAAALARAKAFKAFSIHPSMKQVTPELVSDAHTAEIKVLVYTVNEPEGIAAMRALDVDGVFSDYPERVVAPG
ncbi:MAG: glycerophosphodiester phosphodiesterase [Gammaproteobacteria bacterium]